MKHKTFFHGEKMSLYEELTYYHKYDEDIGMIVRTGYTPVPTLVVGIIILVVALFLAL